MGRQCRAPIHARCKKLGYESDECFSSHRSAYQTKNRAERDRDVPAIQAKSFQASYWYDILQLKPQTARDKNGRYTHVANTALLNSNTRHESHKNISPARLLQWRAGTACSRTHTQGKQTDTQKVKHESWMLPSSYWNDTLFFFVRQLFGPRDGKRWAKRYFVADHSKRNFGQLYQ